jgi:hypothetical protein
MMLVYIALFMCRRNDKTPPLTSDDIKRSVHLSHWEDRL